MPFFAYKKHTMLQNTPQKTMLEISMLSAQNIHNTLTCSSLFPLSARRFRPYVTITTFPTPSPSLPRKLVRDAGSFDVYTTRVDDKGGTNPMWDDEFLIPLDSTFFTNGYSCVILEIYTRRTLMGRGLLGWVQIPASDICNGLLPVGLAHHLSYRLRQRDGSRGSGIVNVSCKVIGEAPVVGHQNAWEDGNRLAPVNTWRIVTGIPLNTWPTGRGVSTSVDDTQNNQCQNRKNQEIYHCKF